jgi:hypothetical protein
MSTQSKLINNMEDHKVVAVVEATIIREETNSSNMEVLNPTTTSTKTKATKEPEMDMAVKIEKVAEMAIKEATEAAIKEGIEVAIKVVTHNNNLELNLSKVSIVQSLDLSALSPTNTI